MAWYRWGSLTSRQRLLPGKLRCERDRPELAGTVSPTARSEAVRSLGHWIDELGLDRADYGTHSMRRTKATLIHRRTKNRQLHTEILAGRAPAWAAGNPARMRRAQQGQPARWCVAPNVVAKLLTPCRDRTPAQWRLVRPRLVRMADSHAFRCELAFLLTASEREHRNERARSRTCEEHRAFHFERWTGEMARASARSGSHVAGARRRLGRRPRGGGHDAAGCRRQDAEYQERRVAPCKRRAHAPHADDDREVRAGSRRHRRNPRSDPAITV